MSRRSIVYCSNACQLTSKAIETNAQTTALSDLSYLPRLVPAPQALIRHDRPERLRPREVARVVSSHSGNSKEQLNHVASLLHHTGNTMEDYAVKAYEVHETLGNNGKRPEVKSRTTGPLSFLALLGFFMSLTLLVVSIEKEDGMSLLATLSLSFVSTIIGIGSRWKLTLPKRRDTRKIPRSDVIIKYPQGAFIVVKCSEEIQRELYWHVEKCDYRVPLRVYRILSLVATLLLMAGVIFLANASILLQILWAGAYVILNAAYWAVAALPQNLHWDLAAFECNELEIQGFGEPGYDKPTRFTDALWLVVAITKASSWAQDFDIAPKSEDWAEWLRKAELQANLTVEDQKEGGSKERVFIIPKWNPQLELTKILRTNSERREAERSA